MASEYKSFYLKDLIPIIEHAALDLMSQPIMNAKKQDGSYMSLGEIANQNSLIAMENSGIKLMATTLIYQLSAEEADGDG